MKEEKYLLRSIMLISSDFYHYFHNPIYLKYSSQKKIDNKLILILIYINLLSTKMSTKKFTDAYKKSDIKELRKYIKRDPVLSTHNFMTRVEQSFMENRDVYDVLILILHNKYDLNKVVKDIIDRDNIDLLENILSSAHGILEESLISHTVPKGRISMAKLMYEYIHDKSNSVNNFESESESESEIDIGGHKLNMKMNLESGLFVATLLVDYDFVYNKNEKSIDSFVIAFSNGLFEEAGKIMPYIDPSVWNNFAIKFIAAADNLYIVKKLLQHNLVDPGVDDNCPFRISLRGDSYEVANELLKHPSVRVDNAIDLDFIIYLIENNCVCSMEKILNSKIPVISYCFLLPEISDLLLKVNNNVTYLVINMQKITITNRKIKSNLKYYKPSKPYVEKPYELKLDPSQIIKQAIKQNDMELAKSIRNYPISIGTFELMCYLMTYKNNNNIDDMDESVCDYIWENVLHQYDPNKLLLTAFVIDRNIIIHKAMEPLNCPAFIDVGKMILNMVAKYDTTLYDKIIEIVKDNPKLDLDAVYEENDTKREFNWEQIKTICNIDELKQFIENLIKDGMIYEPLCEDFDELDFGEKLSELDMAFDNFAF